jgi:hypothetical protein
MVQHLRGFRIGFAFSGDVFLVYLPIDFALDQFPLIRSQFASRNQLVREHHDRIAVHHLLDFFFRTVDAMVVAAGVAAEPVDLAHHQGGTIAVAGFLNGRGCGRMHPVWMAGVYMHHPDPVAENPQFERIEFFSVGADAVVIVFHNQDDRQLSLYREGDRLVELSLA